MRQRFDHRWRKQLLSYAKGNVLEVSVGTGINFSYYPVKVTVVATDTSSRTIEKAKQEAMEKGVKSTFMLSSIDELRVPPHSFDTIVSTFSLCAVNNPVQVLNRFNDWCKPDGTILLLEHGLSTNRVFRWFQKRWSRLHYIKTGCHLDTDLQTVLEQTNPVIKRIERRLGGIVYLVWASPAKKYN